MFAVGLQMPVITVKQGKVCEKVIGRVAGIWRIKKKGGGRGGGRLY